jgi:hypothetical protein
MVTTAEYSARMPADIGAELFQIRGELRRLQHQATIRHLEQKRLAIKCEIAALRFQCTLLRRYHELLRKGGFKPDQPRWPKQSGENSGRWFGGAGTGESGATPNFGSPTRGGHHFVPRKLFEKEPLQPETRNVFDKAVTGPLNAGLHRRDKDHDIYSDAVIERYRRFLDENRTSSAELTPDQARKFVDEVKRSGDARIRGLNLRIYMREIMYWLRRGPRSE